MQLHLSELDLKRFGIPVAIATSIETSKDVNQIHEFCMENSVELSIARVSSANLREVQQMESDGYRLMDTLVYYAFKYAKKSIPEDKGTHHLRPVTQDDIDAVTKIATASFEGYYGHYHADPKLPDDKCDEVYVDWASKSVQSRDIADEVLVVDKDGRLDGFATLRKNDNIDGEGVLFGVAPHAQGQGIYRSMMIHGMRWCQEQGVEKMIVSTQITNIAVQKVWARLGFEMDRSYYTLHKWF